MERRVAWQFPIFEVWKYILEQCYRTSFAWILYKSHSQSDHTSHFPHFCQKKFLEVRETIVIHKCAKM